MAEMVATLVMIVAACSIPANWFSIAMLLIVGIAWVASGIKDIAHGW